MPFTSASLAIRERALGLEHPDLAWSLNGLAELSRTRGALEKAESLFVRALAIRENALGVEHPDVAGSGAIPDKWMFVLAK